MREKKLEDKRREMAAVIAKLNEQNQALEKIISRGNQTRNSLENIYSSGKELDIIEITNYKDFLGRMHVESKNQELKINETQQQLKFKQLQVSEALKDLKVLEKLKETQEKKFYQNYNYIQAKEIDDIASTRYGRTRAAH